MASRRVEARRGVARPATRFSPSPAADVAASRNLRVGPAHADAPRSRLQRRSARRPRADRVRPDPPKRGCRGWEDRRTCSGDRLPEFRRRRRHVRRKRRQSCGVDFPVEQSSGTPRCARRRASDPEGRSRSGGLRVPDSSVTIGPARICASVNSIWLASAARRREPGTRSSGEHSAKCSRSSRSHCAESRVRFADLDDDEVRVQRCDDALDCSAVGQREHRAIAGMHLIGTMLRKLS